MLTKTKIKITDRDLEKLFNTSRIVSYPHGRRDRKHSAVSFLREGHDVKYYSYVLWRRDSA